MDFMMVKPSGKTTIEEIARRYLEQAPEGNPMVTELPSGNFMHASAEDLLPVITGFISAVCRSPQYGQGDSPSRLIN